MQRSALCRSRRELSNAYLLAKFGFDTAENEPSKVCPIPALSSSIEWEGGSYPDVGGLEGLADPRVGERVVGIEPLSAF